MIVWLGSSTFSLILYAYATCRNITAFSVHNPGRSGACVHRYGAGMRGRSTGVADVGRRGKVLSFIGLKAGVI